MSYRTHSFIRHACGFVQTGSLVVCHNFEISFIVFRMQITLQKMGLSATSASQLEQAVNLVDVDIHLSL